MIAKMEKKENGDWESGADGVPVYAIREVPITGERRPWIQDNSKEDVGLKHAGTATYMMLWPEDGRMMKEDIRAVYDGSIFYRIAEKRETELRQQKEQREKPKSK